MPSAAGLPRITLRMVAPGASSNRASCPSSWLPLPSGPVPVKRIRPPSNVPEISMVSEMLRLPLAAGNGVQFACWGGCCWGGCCCGGCCCGGCCWGGCCCGGCCCGGCIAGGCCCGGCCCGGCCAGGCC